MEYGSDEEFSEIVTRNLTRYLTAELANEANYIDEHTRYGYHLQQEIRVRGEKYYRYALLYFLYHLC